MNCDATRCGGEVVPMQMVAAYEALDCPSGQDHSYGGPWSSGAAAQKKTAPLPDALLLTVSEPLLPPLSFPELIVGRAGGWCAGEEARERRRWMINGGCGCRTCWVL
jgi:hypothetical protein